MDEPAAGHGAPRWPWLPFVDLSLTMALVPGFGLGAVMLVAGGAGDLGPGWYAAARQAHGHAQLIGWGGAMILGVGLHFLPRIRGSPPRTSRWLPLWFWLFALGLSLRVLAPLPAVPSGPLSPAALRALLIMGQALEAVGIAGLLGLLVAALRTGPPVEQKKAFAEMRPLLVVAGSSLLLALTTWTIGALGGGAAGERAAPLVDPVLDRVAVDAAAFGFVMALSLAMSARLFPLFFRVRLAWAAGLRAAAWLLGAGVAADVLAGVTAAPDRLVGSAAVLEAAGLAVGIIAVRVFERRQVFPGDRGGYALRRDAPGLAVVSAYGWAAAAALARFLQGLDALGAGALLPLPAWALRLPVHDLALHAVGAGFMTLLILGVGYVLLPGFGGAKAAAPGWAWASLLFGNAAALLRVFTGLAVGMGWEPASRQAPALFAAAGLSGMAAVAAFGLSLAVAWRRAADRVRRGRTPR